jgi:hypothetical protein
VALSSTCLGNLHDLAEFRGLNGSMVGRSGLNVSV